MDTPRLARDDGLKGDDSSLVPQSCILDKAMDLMRENGLFFDRLPFGAILRLEAKDGAILELIKTGPEESRAKLKVEKSKDVDGEYDGYVNGSSFGGSFLKIGWIGVGLKLEFLVKDRSLWIFSWIKTISYITYASVSSSVH